HHGFIHVESKAGTGTTFQIYLPADTTQKTSATADSNILFLPRGNGELVLVIDDEPAIGEIAGIILRGNGYRTLIAADGQEALALFRERNGEIKLVVSDFMMPRMDGPATIREMRRIQPNIQTIIITGLGEDCRIAEAKAAGTNTVICKPFTAEQLLSAIHPLLKN